MNLGIHLSDVAFFGACLALAAIFSAAETSLFALVDARVHDIIKDAVERKSRVRSMLQLWLDHPDRVLTAILLGKHTANVVLVLGVANTIDNASDNLVQSLPWGPVIIASIIGVIVTVELFARAFAKTRAALVAPTVFPVVFVAYYLTLPFVRFLSLLSTLFAQLAGGNASRSGPFVTDQDIVEMIALGRRSGTIDKVEGRMLASIIELGDTLVKELMVPRADISSLPNTASWAEVMTEVKEQGHSRIPVYGGTLDDIKGFFHTKDLLTGAIDSDRFRLRDHLRPVEFVPELMRVADLLRLFQKKKTHLAVVVDEFGGTSGIVALEDVLEEIVGPIQDEHDEEDAPIKTLTETRWSAEGRVSLYDLGEVLHLVFPDGGYETLGGFLIARCGRMPRTGDRISFSGFTFLVTDADERKVSRVDIEKNAIVTLPPTATGVEEHGDGVVAAEPLPTHADADAISEASEISDKNVVADNADNSGEGDAESG
jgi:CBS domain containing-hemolysin-like protein